MNFEEFITEWRSDSDCIKTKTSGSTGEPKEISLPKKFVAESAVRTNDFFNIGNDSLLHSCVSPDFIGGKMMAVRSEIAGCGFTWEIPSNRPFENYSPLKEITLVAVVPSQMLHIVNAHDHLPDIKNIIVGGSSINPDLRKKIYNSGLNAFETYGMTETASHIALRKISPEANWFETLGDIWVSLDEKGCIVIHFPGWFDVVTNDIGELKSSTEFKVSGRIDNLIITGGRKVNPFVLEEKISKFIKTPFIVSSTHDEKWGEKIILKIEGEFNELNEINLMNNLRKDLECWEIPKEIIYYENLPKTENGKIKRQ